MKVRSIELDRAQRGWSCDVYFLVETARQFTPEECAVSTHGRWLITAIWNGLLAARREASQLEATPHERRQKGWG